NLGLLATGSFTLAQWESGGVDLGRLALTIGGVADNPRSTGTLSVDSVAKQLVVTNTVNNLRMKWTGAEGSTWLRRPSDHDRSWQDAAASGENRFYNGDTVIFDGAADDGHEANRVIMIETGGVIASGMEVSGTARYEFHGDGPITVRPDAVGNAAFAATGKLLKSGGGELVFANNGVNTFANGIDMAGGVITFDQARQLATEASIDFSDTGTLRAAGATTDRGTLQGGINIAAGKTAVLEVSSGTLMHSITGTVSSASADSVLRKIGAGELRLFGDSSTNTGAVAVDAGSLRLGADAGLGGRITVSEGATLGGSGTAGAGGGVKVLAGGVLDVGINPATAGRLTVNNLEMTGGAVLRVSLFDADAGDGYRLSDRVLATGASVFSGENYIDLTSFASGMFSLGNIGGLAAGVKTTISGMELPSNGRLSATVSDNGGVLQLVASSDKSRRVAWTGAGGTTWNLVESNWAGTESASTFSYGDHVVFDGAADAAHAGNRSIAINATEVRISDMTVEGGADYMFTGGGIAVSAGHVLANAAGEVELTGATGRLVKSGAGTLTFANSGNIFEGGVNLDGGVIAISHGGQLRTGAAAGIAFTGGGTIRAMADGVALDDDFLIGAGVTGAFDTNGRGMTLQGSVTAAADSFFEKTGAGVLVLGADVSAHAGAIAVRGGSLVVTGEDMLGAAADIVVDAGAVLDLDGHNQSLSRLNGPGEIALGGAGLKMTVDADAAFAGGFSGEGKVYKNGAGKWTLSGSSSHTGGFDYEAGTLGLAGSHALGAGTVTVKTASPVISIEAGGLAIPNDFNLGENNTVISNNGHDVEFSGALAGTGEIRAGGSGVTTLSGRNSYASLIVETPRLVMRRSEAASNRVTINTGSVLEFRSVSGGDVNGILAGDRVLFTSSTLTLRGANAVRDFEVAGGSDLMIDASGALGGAGADVTIRDRGLIRLTKPEVPARNMRVDDGVVVFATYYNMTALKLGGTLDFVNGGEIRLGGLLPTGVYTAAVAAGGIPNMPAYDASQNGMFMVVDIVDGNKLQLTAYNMALEPGKDINVGFDSMFASMRSVYSHVSEEFLAPLVDRGGKTAAKSLWFRAIGSFAEYGDDIDHLGWRDTTWVGVLGCDWISQKDFMLGAYFGRTDTSLETSNNATTGMSLPHGGLYAAWRKGDFYLAADVTAGTGSADTVRREEQGNVVTGGYDLDSCGASLELGCMLHPFPNGGLRPGVGLHFMRLNFHNYRETGLGSVRLDDIKTHALEAVFACDLTREIKLPWGRPGMIDVRMGWRENLRTSQSGSWATMVDYPDARFRIRGDKYDGSGITCGLGLRAALSNRMLFAIAYDFDYIPTNGRDNDTVRNTLNSVLRVSW
ncbi:MAG: autotransporter domain-containing protein, partial [Opitutaceae bacterium]|nr:autotransporter domain-containing protein [Opitutaceae bacterium]